MAIARKASSALVVAGVILLAGCGSGSGSSGPPPLRQSSSQTLTTIAARDGAGQPVNYAGLPLVLNHVSR